jgi:hypothetical protein
MFIFNKQLFTSTFLALTLSACASTETESELGTDIEYNGSDCISIRTIRDYTPLDNQNMLIEAAGRRNYLVTLVMSSFELRSSFQIATQSRDDWLCPYGGDRIVFGSRAEFPASIRSISRLTAEQTEDLLIRYGKMEAPEQERPAPDLKGAEVEELGENAGS